MHKDIARSGSSHALEPRGPVITFPEHVLQRFEPVSRGQTVRAWLGVCRLSTTASTLLKIAQLSYSHRYGLTRASNLQKLGSSHVDARSAGIARREGE